MRSRSLKYLVALSACTLLMGCNPPRITTNVQAFSTPDRLNTSDRVFVAPLRAEDSQSLEAQTYVRLANEEFTKRGFTVVENLADATAIALLGIVIDGGRNESRTYAIPQFGVTGYSGSNTTGTVSRFGNMSTVQATTSYTPQYGVTGYSTGVMTSRVFNRVAMLIISRPVNRGEVRRIFESRGTSEGSCGNLSAIAPTIIQSLFATFPDGGPRNVTVPWSGEC